MDVWCIQPILHMFGFICHHMEALCCLVLKEFEYWVYLVSVCICMVVSLTHMLVFFTAKGQSEAGKYHVIQDSRERH